MARQEKYDDKNPVVSFVIGRFFDRLRGVVAELQPRSVLDAGCGEGEMLRRSVLPDGLHPVCLDLRADSLAEIAEPHRVRASVQALPFAARSFDVVTCLEVLEHLDDPGSAVRDLARVARQAIVLSVPYEPWFRVGNVLRGKHLGALGNHPEHVQHWNLRTFETFLSGSVADVRIVEAFPWIIACCRPNQR
ncbi:MAG: Methyltransferase type 11 [Candidatus Solibacter sp.]|nr:Methyltransferase type 11 [Candidatus Solibacter sp.]